MTDLELWIKRHHRRLAFGLFLQRAGEWLAGFLLLFGAAVLTAKLFLPALWPHVLWLGVLIVPLLVMAGLAARRTPFSRMEAVALLDRQLKGGGLVMALAESDDPAWHGRLPKTPELWRRKLPMIWPVRFLRLIGWPMVFVLGVLLIPLRNPHPAMGFSPAVGRQATTQLENMLGLLEAAHVLPPEETAEMQAVIKMLSEDTEHTPLTSEKWETIDHMRQTLTEKLAEDETNLDQANAIMQKLMSAQGGKLDELLSTKEIDLGKVAGVLQALNDKGALPEIPAALGPQLQQFLKQGQLEFANDPELRNMMLEQMQGLLKTRSMDLQNVRSQFDRVFAQMPNRNTADPEAAPNLATTPNEGGSGGPMKWGKESEEKQSKFKQVVLPPGFLEKNPNQATATTNSNRNPKPVRPSENVSPDLPTEFAPATGSEVRTRELRPQHRAAVKNYFQENPNDQPPMTKPDTMD